MKKEQRKTPELRFPGFTDDWEQRKLPDFVDFFNGLTYTPDDVREEGTLVLRSSNVKNGEVVDADNVYVNPEIAKSENVHVGDIIVVVRNGSRSLIGKHAEIKEIMPDTVIGAFMTGLRSEHPAFVNALLDTPHFFKEIEKNMGATINQITGYMFSQMIFRIPSTAEQKKIGDFFRNIDNTITLHQRKVDQIKEYKKGMLQKMFPKKGARVPEIRFPGFTDDWEQRKFSELAKLRRGLTYKPSDICEDGIRVLRSSNINENTFVIGKDDVFVKKEAINIPYAHSGDILITSANGSSRLVGKHTLINGIPDNSTVHGGFMLLASAKNPQFVNALMSSSWYTRFINTYVAGGNGAIGNLSKSDLDGQDVLVPSEPEQHQIGMFFQNLNNAITLHQRKLESIKEYKKGLLQKMFV